MFKWIYCWWKRFRGEYYDPRNIKPLPPGPDGTVGYSLYESVRHPGVGMLCWKMSDGSLIPFHKTETWVPDINWRWVKDRPLGVNF